MSEDSDQTLKTKIKRLLQHSPFLWKAQQLFFDTRWEIRALLFHPEKAYFTTGLIAKSFLLTHQKEIQSCRQKILEVEKKTRGPLPLGGCTFIIPVKYDSPERKRNLETAVSFLNTYFEAPIFICEEGKTPAFDYLRGRSQYVFFQTRDDDFHKAKLINLGVKKSTTDFFIIYDADILVDPAAILFAKELLKKKKTDIIHPCFDTLNLDPERTKKLAERKITKEEFKEAPAAAKKWPGGIVAFRKEAFIKAGMMNEKFVSWGLEDHEIRVRMKKLGSKEDWLPFSMLHLWHPRAETRLERSAEQAFLQNKEEYDHVKQMNRKELLAYIETWKWR